MAKGRYSKYLDVFLFFGDFLFLNLAFIGGYYLRFHDLSNVGPRYTGLHFFVNLCWLTASFFNNMYRSFSIAQAEKILITYLKSIIVFFFLVLAYFFSSRGYDYSRLQLGYVILLFSVLILLERVILILFVRRYRYKGYNYKTAIVIGDGLEAFKLYHYLLSDKAMGYKFFGFFFDGTDKYQKYKRGNLSEVQDFCEEKGVDEIFYSLSAGSEKYLNEIITYCDNHFIRLRILPSLNILNGKQFSIDFYDRTPVLSFRKEPLEDTFNRVLKRAFDIIFSLVTLLVLIPFVFPFVALAVKFTSKGPIFFRQLRSGRKNKFFYCYKFRTMQVNRDADHVQAVKGDYRITSIGGFLRKSNIDELPQFINVLWGNMSVVGPRPHMIKHTEQYSKLIEKYMVRHVVKPGITGFAQVNGYRGETTDAKKMKKRVMYDVWYIENWSFLLDIYIVFKTIGNVIKGEKNAV
jgi:Undecaprenyl-phosphate glucose phosphotransferase